MGGESRAVVQDGRGAVSWLSDARAFYSRAAAAYVR